MDVRWLRSQIGFVEQEPTLFDRSIDENVRYGRPRASDDDVRAACELANAHEFISELPEGYATAPGEKGARISGGQKQRVAIARTAAERLEPCSFAERPNRRLALPGRWSRFGEQCQSTFGATCSFGASFGASLEAMSGNEWQ